MSSNLMASWITWPSISLRRLFPVAIDEITDPDRFELHDDYAAPLPVIVICELLGIPAGDRVQFKTWSDAQVAAMGAPDPAQYEDQMAALAAYLELQSSSLR